MKDKLKILFEDKQVQDISLIVVSIVNSGNLPILPTDYEHPVSLGFGEKAEILTVDVIKRNPNDLKVSAGIEGNEVVVSPALLNPGDWITLKLMVSQAEHDVQMSGRIAGVKSLEKVPEFSRRWVVIMLIGTLVFGLSLGMATLLLSPILALAGFFSTLLFLLIASLDERRREKEYLRMSL